MFNSSRYGAGISSSGRPQAFSPLHGDLLFGHGISFFLPRPVECVDGTERLFSDSAGGCGVERAADGHTREFCPECSARSGRGDFRRYAGPAGRYRAVPAQHE